MRTIPLASASARRRARLRTVHAWCVLLVAGGAMPTAAASALPSAAATAGDETPAHAPGSRPWRPKTVAPASTVVGRVDVQAGILSAALPTPRRLFVWLPEDYSTARRYPVVYAPDGQDLFDAATAAGGEEWAIDELLAAHPPGIPAVIVVGIEAAPDALREYAPPESRDGARGDDYVRLVTDVVKPFVDAHYSTTPGRAGTLMLGAGAGGVIAIYAAWTRPDVFGGAAALELPDTDPSGWMPSQPDRARPRLWIEQTAGDAAERPSTTALLTLLQRGAEVQYLLAGPHASRIARLAAGLRAILGP